MEKQNDDDFLTPEDLVTRYKGKITKTTLANWRSTKEGPDYQKIGGRVLYPKASVIAWEKVRTIARQSHPK